MNLKGLKGKKGMELPISVLVVLIILIIVLAILVLWFTKSSAQGEHSTSCQMAFSSECAKFSMAGGCKEGSTLNPENYFTESKKTGCYGDASKAAEACCS